MKTGGSCPGASSTCRKKPQRCSVASGIFVTLTAASLRTTVIKEGRGCRRAVCCYFGRLQLLLLKQLSRDGILVLILRLITLSTRQLVSVQKISSSRRSFREDLPLIESIIRRRVFMSLISFGTFYPPQETMQNAKFRMQNQGRVRRLANAECCVWGNEWRRIMQNAESGTKEAWTRKA